MTNYNESLDEIIRFVNIKGYVGGDNKLRSDITSLMKELVAEAKPCKYSSGEYILNVDGIGEVDGYEGYNQAIDQFEQNLLKALEEI